MDVNVSYPRFDDLGELFAALLVGRDTDFGFVVLTVIEVGGYGWRKGEDPGLRELIEGITLVGMFIIHGDPGFWRRCESGGFSGLGVEKGLVQEAVEGAMLSLRGGNLLA